ncbi:restriction endonuclease subunit S [Ligilactobacillus agilis]|uniref:restriction endonuclease subunit S n=1 Tax=Ligilactobacillus agilis TaxID=1601 RepID=UPI000B8D53B0|nr:restriction endonuclease subunit S [Ligilactobacillus agilis]ASR40519.1 hypothetical protein BEN83_03005 [Ligilactobacillus agilis]
MDKEQIGIPKLRFPGFTGAWEQRRLGEVADSVEYGINAPAKEYDGINKYLRITDIDDTTHEFLQSDLTSPDTDLTLAEKFKLLEGDILFARTGASVGKSYIYSREDGSVYYAGFLIRMRFNKSISPNFIFQNTLTTAYKQYVEVTSQRSGQPGVNAKEYSNYSLYIPSKEEQQKIGSFFQQLDTLIALHQRKLEHLKQQKNGLLQKMFPKNGESVPEVRFPGFTAPWEQRRLGEVADSVEYGINAPAKEYDGINKYLRITDIDDTTHEFLQSDLTSPDTDLTLAEKFKLLEGDILFARTGASVGKSYIYSREDGSVYYAGFLIRMRFNKSISPNFIFQNTLTTAYKRYVEVTSQRSGQPGVNAKEYSNYSLYIPSKEEQQKIGSFFQQLDTLIALQQRRIEHLELLKKGLLQQMFV